MMRKVYFMKGLVVGIIFLFLLVGIYPSSAIFNVRESNILSYNGNTLYVGGSGEGNYTSIQSAIKDANVGDTVFVYDDSSPYYENILVDKSIYLIGEDKYTTVIDGFNNSTVVIISANKVTITGFTIQNGEDYNGIYIYSNFNRIKNNIITSNRPWGIGLKNAHFNTVEENVITGNHFIGIVSGKDAYFNIIKNNIITNHTSVSFCIGIIVCSNTIVVGNIISSNDLGIDLREHGKNIIIRNNIINNKKRGLDISFSINNLILQNNFLNNKEDASFTIHKRLHMNFFFGNYWNEPLNSPKIIDGTLMWWNEFLNDWEFYDWTYIDRFPAKEPYEI